MEQSRRSFSTKNMGSWVSSLFLQYRRWRPTEAELRTQSQFRFGSVTFLCPATGILRAGAEFLDSQSHRLFERRYVFQLSWRITNRTCFEGRLSDWRTAGECRPWNEWGPALYRSRIWPG